MVLMPARAPIEPSIGTTIQEINPVRGQRQAIDSHDVLQQFI
jgi:hypothetical protein